MAKVRSNGGYYMLSLFVMGIITAGSLAGFIATYTKIEQHKADARTAIELQKKHYNQEDRSLYPAVAEAMAAVESGVPAAFSNDAEMRRNYSTFLAHMNWQIGKLKAQLLALDQMNKDNLGKISRQDAETKIAEAKLAERTNEVNNTKILVEGEIKEKESQIVRLDALIKEREVASQRLQESSQARFDQLASSVEQQDQDWKNKLQAKDAEIDDARKLIAQKDTELQDLTRMIRNANRKELPQVTSSDGLVSRVLTDGTVYINLGREDKIRPGYTFEVFPANGAIRVDAGPTINGYATLEVFQAEEGFSMCRVVRKSRNAELRTGDQIANIIFDKSEHLTFMPYGAFDLAGTGDIRAGQEDMLRVISMIERYGAEARAVDLKGINLDEITVETEVKIHLSPDVDYLVLGLEPKMPQQPEDTLDVEAMATYNAALRDYKIYNALLEQARGLQIPVLNQNRFKELVGYYVR